MRILNSGALQQVSNCQPQWPNWRFEPGEKVSWSVSTC